MQSSKCLFNTSAALRRVFIYPLEAARPEYIHQSLRRNLAVLQTRPQISKIFAIQSRSYATARAAERDRPLRDREIKNAEVNIVDEDGVFHDPVPTREVLANLPPNHHLVCVAKPPDDWRLPAICKILSNVYLAELAAREKQLAKEMKKKDPSKIVKTLELNWAIDKNDLGHRIAKMREFLGKGNRVEVVISPKRKGRKAGVEEAEEVLRRLRQVVTDEEGKAAKWKEYKAMEGEVPNVVTLSFEGSIDPEVAAREKEMMEMEKKKEKEAKAQEMENEKQMSKAKEAKREKWKKKEMGELV